MNPTGRARALPAATLAAVSLTVLVSAAATSRARATDPLADLERRIGILENVGPFQVLDRDHTPIFEVRNDGPVNEASVMAAKSGAAVVTMGATSNGGYFLVEGPDPETARMGSEGAWAGLRFQDVALVKVDSSSNAQKTMLVSRLELGRMPAGNYSLKFLTQGGAPIAAIGESQAGSGALVIGTSAGRRVASMFVGENNKGMIGIWSGEGAAVAVLGEAFGNTGGSLVLGTEGSEPRVKIGTADNRYGLVETLPPSTVYVPRSGISGSYILGCAGGTSCVH